MTVQEAARVVAAVRMLWPHSNLGGQIQDVIRLWHSLLGDHEQRDVDAAIRELAAQGREHAPPVGVVVKTLAERAAVMPDWDEVLGEVEHALKTYRRPTPQGGFSSEREMHGPPPAEYWSHPMIAAFITPAWHEWRACVAKDWRTFYAQQRDAWAAVARRVQRDTALGAIGAPRRQRGELARPRYLQALPSPSPEAAA